jgi:hypothetical protein
LKRTTLEEPASIARTHAGLGEADEAPSGYFVPPPWTRVTRIITLSEG